MGLQLRLLPRRSPALALLLSLCAACAAEHPGSDLHLELVPASEGKAAHVRVTGLSSAELAGLRDVGWDASAWRQLLRVSVETTSDTAIAGEYGIADRTVVFEPAFPFDPGRRYVVHFDPSRLPSPRDVAPVRAAVALPAVDPGPPVTVTAIYPSAEVWPENLLRFYIHFSGPMARQPGVAHVRLIDEQGNTVRDALLESPVDFWSPDQQRYTVFFDPGRVKSDLVPNQELGRALVAGRRYTIEVDAGWSDASGRPLRETFRKPFRAGPSVDRPLALAEWQLAVPAARSRDPLVVTLPRPLDRALLERTLGVAAGGEAVDGRVEVAKQETEWRFVPALPWTAAPHEVVILSVLEDPQGNLIDQAFEVDPKTEPDAPARPERYTIPFSPG